ncbi:uncharacterized protein LOC120989755 isoform X2 [Bufo bufo]|uniref:uncharacterized protein LOC120989755 isoform X2 n=1 Tax=Bufo bufo TaxID=8384 RepID=UPI001ABDEE44|nr:uncharacterized protein LOC120989755 isoform X2 [Bufo bufo]
MSANSSLNQLKKKYRNRYYGYRGRDVSALEPGDNAMSFLQQYFHISDREEDDDEEFTATGRSGHFVMQQSGKKKGQSSASKSCGNDAHQHFQGAEHSFKQSNTPAVPQKNEKQSDISYIELFSDGESDNEKTYEVAKLIEESLADHDDVEDDQLVNSSEKPREKLYSSDSSVVREPPSPTSNIHAKKWLSFKEATFGATHSVFANIVSTPSAESRKNAQQLKLQDAIKSNGADITYELHSEPSDDGLVIEDESRYNLNAWISSSKKKNAPQSPSRAKEDKPTTTPKKAIEAPSSVRKKSENIKESLTSNVTAKRLVIEDESRYNLNAWISSSKKKNAPQSPSRAKEDKPTTTPKKAIEAHSSAKKKSENIKESLTSNVTAKRSNEEFVIEDVNRHNFNAWNSPFKKQKSSPPAGPKEDSPTPTPKKIETPSSLQKIFETVKASLTSSVAVERAAIPEKTNDVNVRKTSFSDIFFRTAKLGHIGTSRLSSVVYESPATSTAVGNEEEFEIEDLSDTNESHFIKIPVKAKSLQLGQVGKLEKSGPQLQKTDIDGSDSESEMITAAVPKVIESPKQHVGSSQEVERRESIHQVYILPIESQEEHLENSSSNSIEQVQQPQQIRPRTKSDCSAVKIFGDLDETFNITGRKGKGQIKAKAATKRTKKSKQSEANRGEHNVQEKKKRNAPEKKAQKSSKQGRLSKAGNRSQSVKDLISNDLEPEEILEISTIKYASGKRTHNGEMVKADVKKNVEATVSRQSHSESSEIDTCEAPDTVTDVDHQTKKRIAKMKNVSTPCPADNTEESVFQSGPVLRQRAVLSAESMKPLPCDLDSTDSESEGEQQISAEDDKLNVNSEEFLKRYSIVFDPDTGSDALVECIAHGDRSKFVGNDNYTYWDSFKNEFFTTGKLIMAPRKKSRMHIFKSKIMVFYVEQGQVQVNLNKSERILKNGDFFFVPPVNSCTITNLQDEEAVLVYNFLNMVALFTEG